MATKFTAIALVAFLSATEVSADWFVDDPGGTLLLVGVGQTPSGVMGYLSMSCQDGRIRVYGYSTAAINAAEDVAEFDGMRISLRYGGGVITAKGAIAVEKLGVVRAVTELDEKDSAAVMQSIASGKPLDVEVSHRLLEPELNSVRVSPQGYTQVISAIVRRCPELLQK